MTTFFWRLFVFCITLCMVDEVPKKKFYVPCKHKAPFALSSNDLANDCGSVRKSKHAQTKQRGNVSDYSPKTHL